MRFFGLFCVGLSWKRAEASSEFLVVEGSFGDEWKDSVLVGEYKRVAKGSIRARNGYLLINFLLFNPCGLSDQLFVL